MATPGHQDRPPGVGENFWVPSGIVACLGKTQQRRNSGNRGRSEKCQSESCQ